MKNGLYRIVITIVLIALTLPRSIAENTGLRRGRGHILAAVSSTTLEEQYDRGEGKEQEEMSERKLWWFHKEKWKLWYCSKWGHTHWGAKFCKPKCIEGTISVDEDASIWDSEFALVIPSIISIQGGGQCNGGFTMLEVDNIQVGIRAQDRSTGVVVPVSGTDSDGATVGVYDVGTGYDPQCACTDRAWWNFDWHVDLRSAGQTLEDYGTKFKLTAKCIDGYCGSFTSYEVPLAPFTFNELDIVTGATELYQGSENLLFDYPWNDDNDYDVNAEAVYEFCVVLGDLCPVCMHVNTNSGAAEGQTCVPQKKL